MADVTMTVNQVTHKGTNRPTATTLVTADKYFIRNAGNILIVFENTNTSTRTITFDITQTFQGIAAVTDPTVTVQAQASSVNGLTLVGPFPRGYNDADGDIAFTVSATGVTATAYSL